VTVARALPRRAASRRGRRLLLIASAVLVVLSLWPLAHAGSALIVTRELASPDAILMLASHEWERLPAAAALARKYPDAVVLLTVPTVISLHNCHLCRERVAWLEAEGVNPARVRVLPRRVRNTYEEAQAARSFALSAGLVRILVVTSPYHSRRAWATFSHVFQGTPVSLGVNPAAGGRRRGSTWWISPYDRHYIRYEWAAILKYRAVHGIPIQAPG
jgi:uncharacterized SAM-binding protein YcdF (DUF218 family)